MNRGDLIILGRAYPKEARKKVIVPTVMNKIFQLGINDIAFRTNCLPANETFKVTAGDGEYDLSTELTRYIKVHESGLWWYTGSAWFRLRPRTLKWLDNNKSNWRDASNGSPLNYAIEGDTLFIDPPPDTTLTDGFKMYFYQKPLPMTSDSHFPFGYTSEISRLAILDDVILLYWEYRSLKMLKQTQAAMAAYSLYKNECFDKKKLLQIRRDISGARQTRHKIRHIGDSY